jgi:hypothetical protein
MAKNRSDEANPDAAVSDAGAGTRAEARKVSEADHGTAQVEGTYSDVPDDEKPDPTSIMQTQDVPDEWPSGTDPLPDEGGE